MSAITIHAIVLLCLGVYMISFALLMHVANLASTIVFKIMPFFGGLYAFLLGLKFLNIL
jgi:hypothetical protein